MGLAKGITGHALPVYFLDTEVEGNGEWERTLTHTLYGGDVRYRLALLTLELLGEELGRSGQSEIAPEHIDALRRRCVFTSPMACMRAPGFPPRSRIFSIGTFPAGGKAISAYALGIPPEEIWWAHQTAKSVPL